MLCIVWSYVFLPTRPSNFPLPASTLSFTDHGTIPFTVHNLASQPAWRQLSAYRYMPCQNTVSNRFNFESPESFQLARVRLAVPCAVVHQQSYRFKMPLIPIPWHPPMSISTPSLEKTCVTPRNLQVDIMMILRINA